MRKFFIVESWHSCSYVKPYRMVGNKRLLFILFLSKRHVLGLAEEGGVNDTQTLTLYVVNVRVLGESLIKIMLICRNVKVMNLLTCFLVITFFKTRINLFILFWVFFYLINDGHFKFVKYFTNVHDSTHLSGNSCNFPNFLRLNQVKDFQGVR